MRHYSIADRRNEIDGVIKEWRSLWHKTWPDFDLDDDRLKLVMDRVLQRGFDLGVEYVFDRLKVLCLNEPEE